MASISIKSADFISMKLTWPRNLYLVQSVSRDLDNLVEICGTLEDADQSICNFQANSSNYAYTSATPLNVYVRSLEELEYFVQWMHEDYAANNDLDCTSFYFMRLDAKYLELKPEYKSQAYAEMPKSVACALDELATQFGVE